MSLAFWFSVAVLAASVAIYGDVFLGWRRLRQLRDIEPRAPTAPLRVSIIVAARNEAHAIERAIRSILAIDYPALEIVAVDDRSTDATGEILDRVRAEFPNLEVVHVTELPPGWLGKNHALHQGAGRASGDYLLFTDADVVYEPTAIKRAVAHCEAERLDHLTLIPDLVTRSAFVAIGMIGGFVGILALERPWRSRVTRKARVGIGAFNMVRAAPYRAAGGHEALAMEVLDDIELGRMMSKGELRQELMLANGLLEIEMYRGPKEMLAGIQKNVFTFLEYSLPMLLLATGVQFAFSIWPYLGIFVTDGATQWVVAGSAAVAIALYLHLAPRFGYSRWCVAWLPVMGFVTIALMWQIAIRTWYRGGIVWRGTFYRLSEIRDRRRSRAARQSP